MLDFDASELTALAAEMAAAPAKVIPALLPVANKAGVRMKGTLRKDSSGHDHFARLPFYAEYDVEQTATSLTIEAGFRKEGQGNLANIAAFGSVNNAPIMDITRALTDEVPAFMRWVAKVGADAL